MAVEAEEPKQETDETDAGKQCKTAELAGAPGTGGAEDGLTTDSEAPKPSGAEKFFAAVDAELADKGGTLASKLMNLAVAGNLWSAKLLIAAIEKAPRKQTAQMLLSKVADKWASEPEWSGEPLSEQTAEVGAGGREPEG